MIIQNALTEIDIGRLVEYSDGKKEPIQGLLKSWNDHFVFVVFHCYDQDNFLEYTAQACNADYLTFI